VSIQFLPNEEVLHSPFAVSHLMLAVSCNRRLC